MQQSPQQVTENLRAAGCPEAFIRDFLRALKEDSPARQRRLLEQQRASILAKLHEQQKKLECFDYLRYQLQKEQEEHICIHKGP